MTFVYGILCGIMLSLFFSFGAAFVQLIQMSMQYGFRRTMPFAFGVSLSDIIIIGLMLTVLRNVDMTAVLHSIPGAIIGFAVVAFMGIITYRKDPAKERSAKRKPKTLIEMGEKLNDEFSNNDTNPVLKFFRELINPTGKPRRRNILIQGFLINFTNPLVWIYWAGVVALTKGEFNFGFVDNCIFFAGLLATNLAVDVLKCRLSSMLNSIMTDARLRIINRISGVVIILFGCFLLGKMVVYQINPDSEKEDKSFDAMRKLHETTDSINAKANEKLHDSKVLNLRNADDLNSFKDRIQGKDRQKNSCKKG